MTHHFELIGLSVRVGLNLLIDFELQSRNSVHVVECSVKFWECSVKF